MWAIKHFVEVGPSRIHYSYCHEEQAKNMCLFVAAFHHCPVEYHDARVARRTTYISSALRSSPRVQPAFPQQGGLLVQKAPRRIRHNRGEMMRHLTMATAVVQNAAEGETSYELSSKVK